MIVKKLRDKNNWSQEQLATMTGLSIRTIQRVESGQNASLETLKCLASVFEVDIEKLTEEITVIDKESAKWLAQPWWFRASFLGIGSRRCVIWIELLCLIAGFVSWFLTSDRILAPTCFLSAYITGWYVRYGDEKDVW